MILRGAVVFLAVVAAIGLTARFHGEIRQGRPSPRLLCAYAVLGVAAVLAGSARSMSPVSAVGSVGSVGSTCSARLGGGGGGGAISKGLSEELAYSQISVADALEPLFPSGGCGAALKV